MHCMSPVYLEKQIERSRGNLGLELSTCFISTPGTQLADVSREAFRQRLKDAFALLEKMVKAGKLQYTACDLEAFRVPRVPATTWIFFELENRPRGCGRSTTASVIQLPSVWPCRRPMGWSTSELEKKRCRCSQRRRVWESRHGSAHALPGKTHAGLPVSSAAFWE